MIISVRSFRCRASESFVRNVWRWCYWRTKTVGWSSSLPASTNPVQSMHICRCPLHLAAEIHQIFRELGERPPSSWWISPPQSKLHASIHRRTLTSTHRSKSAMGVSSGPFLQYHLPMWESGSRPHPNQHHFGLLHSSRNTAWNLPCILQFKVGLGQCG